MRDGIMPFQKPCKLPSSSSTEVTHPIKMHSKKASHAGRALPLTRSSSQTSGEPRYFRNFLGFSEKTLNRPKFLVVFVAF